MKKVLVADDTKNIRTLLTTCLEVNGYNVLTASNGLEAMELLKSEKFDLAFIDIKMPEISGTEVLRKIRLMGIEIPVVIMTAFATVKNAVECTKLGAVSYLQKPFTADKVRNVLDGISEFDSSNKAPSQYIDLAKQLFSSNDHASAFDYLKKALSIDPTKAEVYYLIGRIYESDNNLDMAQKFFACAKEFER